MTISPAAAQPRAATPAPLTAGSAPGSPLDLARGFMGMFVGTATFRNRPWFGHDVHFPFQAGSPYGPTEGFASLGAATLAAQQHAEIPYPIKGAPRNPFGEASAILTFNERFVPMHLNTDLLAHTSEGDVTLMKHVTPMPHTPLAAVVDGAKRVVPLAR